MSVITVRKLHPLDDSAESDGITGCQVGLGQCTLLPTDNVPLKEHFTTLKAIAIG